MRKQRYFNEKDRLYLLRLIREKTGYSIQSKGILSQAFRRRSYCAGEGGKSNEMFEFIGDQVLNYYVVKIITERCKAMNIEGDYAFRIQENHFTNLKQTLVSNEVFAQIIDQWDIAEYMIVGKSDEDNSASEQTKVKADLFEAIIGAIAMDSQWDPAVLEVAVSKALTLEDRLQAMIKNDCFTMTVNLDNAINTLKELAEKESCSIPKYDFFGPESHGYDSDGNPVWYCYCSVINDETGIMRCVYASSKKDAKKAASYLVLCEHLALQNQYGPNDFVPIWIYKNGKLTPTKP